MGGEEKGRRADLVLLQRVCNALGEIFRLSSSLDAAGDYFQEDITDVFLNNDIPIEANWSDGLVQFKVTE